ncbi:related to tetracenomycin polyketide synthesis hydroxylase tcmG [Phialocephala subalpina]|uniref:Related to tetracenomycin polyketide synthesis hydroxylase tcmG n=1 Tax=Phialocephala subalpina TaxID=576137 RepID=A0A1L7WVC3_9HELO|nr:related to tetracenomycin polyketide synthesis hydroxylase tcmG [Phialocephala subalpina]
MGETDVLIVGGGPTGLMLALELTSQDIPFRIIDSSPIRSDKSRALVLHSRTLELLNRHGIAQEFVDRGNFNLAVRIFANQKFVFENDFNIIAFNDTMYQNPLIISQAEIESILDEVLMKHQVKVERPVTAEKISQDETGVTAVLRHEDGSEESLRCKYAVGCDGPRSIVRNSAGLQFEGAAYPQDFILADVHMKWETRECLHIYLGASGFMIVFPMKDNVWRLICSRREALGADAEPTLENFQEMLDKLLPEPVQIFDPVWISRFKLHHRIADNYRAGRMLVAGDAAHVHSPAGGQGMNTGMHDAVNLGWKLASVIRGENDDSLLDSYNIERRRVGQTLLQGTDRLFEFMATTNPLYLFIRNYVMPFIMPWAMAIPGRRALAYRFVSELGIRYRKSPIVGQATTWKGTLKGGDRVPDGRLLKGNIEITVHSLLGARKHSLLLFSGVDGVTSTDDLEKAHVEFIEASGRSIPVYTITKSSSENIEIMDPEGLVHRLFGFTASGFVLVRPDGHIAFIGPLTSMDELKTWMER